MRLHYFLGLLFCLLNRFSYAAPAVENVETLGFKILVATAGTNLPHGSRVALREKYHVHEHYRLIVGTVSVTEKQGVSTHTGKAVIIRTYDFPAFAWDIIKEQNADEFNVRTASWTPKECNDCTYKGRVTKTNAEISAIGMSLCP